MGKYIETTFIVVITITILLVGILVGGLFDKNKYNNQIYNIICSNKQKNMKKVTCEGNVRMIVNYDNGNIIVKLK